MEHGVVYRNDGEFCAWPFNGGFWQFADGELAVSFMRAPCTYATPGSVGHNAIDQNMCQQIIIRSFDGGATWPVETVETVFQRAVLDDQVAATSWVPGLPALNNRNPSADGFCLVAGYGIPPESLRDRLYVLVSTDRGHTWAPMVRVPPCGFFALYGRPSAIVRPDGMLLLFAHGSRLNVPAGETAGFTPAEKEAIPLVFGSRNGGYTWGLIGEITPSPTQPMAIMPYPILLRDGRILAAVRRQYGAAYNAHTQVYESDDGGRSWRFLSRPNDWGAPANLVELPDGRLVCVYGYRQPPYGVRATVSRDGGRTWGDEIVLRDDGGSWDLGYPRTMLRPDGKLVTVYYFNGKSDSIQQDGGVRHIAFTIWSV
jgi:hypothetical protein